MNIILLFTFLVFLVSFASLHLSGFRLFGINAHPLAFLIWLQIFILTLVGTIGVGLFNWPMAYGAGAAVSAETRSEVVLLTLSSISVLFFGLAFLFKSKTLVSMSYRVQISDFKIVRKLTIISIALIILKLGSTSEIPLFLALGGDIVGAAEAKVNILTKKTGITLFGLNYIIRSFSSYIYIASVLMYARDQKNKNFRNLFLVNLVLATIDSMYDVQKALIVFIALFTFWLFYIQKGDIRLLLKGGLIAIILAAAMFMLTLDYDTGQEIFIDTLNRIFVAQTEGMFFIRELIEPSTKYMWLGFPLANLFELTQLDPAAEVIPILFPTVGYSWLNSNTYFIAHAWSIFGNWAIFLGPLFVLINIVLILIISKLFLRNGSVIHYAVIFWLIIKMPITSIFTEFLWMKVTLDVVINITFMSVLLLLLNTKITKNRNSALKLI